MNTTHSSLFLSVLATALLTFSDSSNAREFERISEGPGGTQVFAPSLRPAMTPDGRYIAFESASSLLLPNNEDTNGSTDIFVVDRQNGTLERVSVRTGGAEQAGNSTGPSISNDGRYVCFISSAPLEASDTNMVDDVYVHDRDTNTTMRVSVSSAGVAADDDSYSADISGDGTAIVFDTDATTLLAGSADGNGETDVYLHILNWSGNGTTTRISVDDMGGEGMDTSTFPLISDDANIIYFNSRFNGLISPPTPDFSDNVFRYQINTDTITCISVDENGDPLAGQSFLSGISGDGKYCAFTSLGSGIAPGDASNFTNRNVFVRNTTNNSNYWLSQTSDGSAPNGDCSGRVSFSDDGRFVAFVSKANNLLAPGEDTNSLSISDIFLRDTNTDKLIKITVDGTTQTDKNSSSPELSSDGTLIAFETFSDVLLASDNNNLVDVYFSSPTPVNPNANSNALKAALLKKLAKFKKKFKAAKKKRKVAKVKKFKGKIKKLKKKIRAL